MKVQRHNDIACTKEPPAGPGTQRGPRRPSLCVSAVMSASEEWGAPGFLRREHGILTLGRWFLLHRGHSMSCWGQRFFTGESAESVGGGSQGRREGGPRTSARGKPQPGLCQHFSCKAILCK